MHKSSFLRDVHHYDVGSISGYYFLQERQQRQGRQQHSANETIISLDSLYMSEACISVLSQFAVISFKVAVDKLAS